MNVDNLLKKLEADCLLELKDKEIYNILEESKEKIFKNKDISTRELDKARSQIRISLESFDKRNPVFNYLVDVLKKR